MVLDVVLLARLQFALTIMFHYLFPPLTIGMGVVLVYLEARFLATKLPIYEIAARFWTQIFALNFAIGVVTGIVMEFEFGTNWAAYSRYVGDVFGAALAAEGIFAFFLESGFLAVLIFGWDKVSPRFHFFSTLMVAIGGCFSAVWIIVANSWQQTPAGHVIRPMLRDGQPWVVNGHTLMRAELADFWTAVLNPSTLDRLMHTLIGAFIMGAFFILSISAWYLLKGRHVEFARRSFDGALLFATIFSLLQLVSGHSNASMVARQQPAKMAALEGHFTTGPADLTLIGWPDARNGRVAGRIAIPGGLSWLIAGDSKASVLGLDKFPPEYRPPVWISFMSYHAMVGIGVFFIGLTLVASALHWRGRLFEQRWLMWVFVLSVLPAVAANQLGWAAAEVGRQPWIVHPNVQRDAGGNAVLDENGYVKYVEEGLLTSKAVSEVVTGEQVLGSIILFGLIYLMLGAVWVFVLNHKIQKGPAALEVATGTTLGGLSAAVAARVGHESSMTEAKQPGGD